MSMNPFPCLWSESHTSRFVISRSTLPHRLPDNHDDHFLLSILCWKSLHMHFIFSPLGLLQETAETANHCGPEALGPSSLEGHPSDHTVGQQGPLSRDHCHRLNWFTIQSHLNQFQKCRCISRFFKYFRISIIKDMSVTHGVEKNFCETRISATTAQNW